MDEDTVRQYLDKVPVEVREAVMELDTPYKWAVFIALTVDGDKYFNQLKKEFSANPKTLTDVLRSLVAGGLVDRKVKRLADAGDTNRNYYASTKLGEKILTGLYEVVLPPREPGVKQNRAGEMPASRKFAGVRGRGERMTRAPAAVEPGLPGDRDDRHRNGQYIDSSR